MKFLAVFVVVLVASISASPFLGELLKNLTGGEGVIRGATNILKGANNSLEKISKSLGVDRQKEKLQAPCKQAIINYDSSLGKTMQAVEDTSMPMIGTLKAALDLSVKVDLDSQQMASALSGGSNTLNLDFPILVKLGVSATFDSLVDKSEPVKENWLNTYKGFVKLGTNLKVMANAAIQIKHFNTKASIDAYIKASLKANAILQQNMENVKKTIGCANGHEDTEANASLVVMFSLYVKLTAAIQSQAQVCLNLSIDTQELLSKTVLPVVNILEGNTKIMVNLQITLLTDLKLDSFLSETILILGGLLSALLNGVNSLLNTLS